jgi:DNA-binding PadR family transcriptional regulator
MSLAYAIMTALIDDEMTGYELARSFDSGMGFFWRASHQQIYRELHTLSERKWLRRRTVKKSGGAPQYSYRMTRSGRRALKDWVYEGSRHTVAKDDLLLKLCNLEQGNRAHLVGEIERRRELMMRRLYLYESVTRGHYADPESLPDRRKGVYLALRAGISQGEQFLQWCDEALTLLGTVRA